jgi:quercetin dioxygenase-like cupin family protein
MKTRLRWLAVLFLCPLLYSQVPEVEITAEPAHHLVLQNDYIRAFKVEAPPHAATLMHRHRHDYFFVTLGATEVSNEVEGKPPVTLKLQDGETRFVPGGFAHIVRNLANTPFRNLTIEFLKDDQARKSPPPPWDEERGLNVLHGGTQDILFVKDGVRVSEIQLQPGGMVPKHHHAGPHLVVAVSDLNFRNDVEGKASATTQLKAGEIKWLEGGYSHTLTNIGKNDARWVTLEFH